MSTKLLLVVCAVAASANEDSTANFKDQAFVFYQTASNSAIGVVNSIWGNADHGVSDADKEALASLEQEVESLAIKARSLAKRNPQNFRVQYIASTLTNAEDSLEDIVAPDQTSQDSRSIDVGIYQILPVVRLGLEIFSLTIIAKAVLPFTGYVSGPFLKIVKLVGSILAVALPYAGAAITPIIGQFTAFMALNMPTLGILLASLGLSGFIAEVTFVLNAIQKNVGVFRVLLDIFAIMYVISSLVYTPAKPADAAPTATGHGKTKPKKKQS